MLFLTRDCHREAYFNQFVALLTSVPTDRTQPAPTSVAHKCGHELKKNWWNWLCLFYTQHRELSFACLHVCSTRDERTPRQLAPVSPALARPDNSCLAALPRWQPSGPGCFKKNFGSSVRVACSVKISVGVQSARHHSRTSLFHYCSSSAVGLGLCGSVCFGCSSYIWLRDNRTTVFALLYYSLQCIGFWISDFFVTVLSRL